MIKNLEVVRIKDLQVPDDQWNGQIAIAVSDEYIHPKAGRQVVKIKISDTLWAVEANNLEVVSPNEKDDFIKGLDGNQIVEWSKCLWQPKLTSGKDPT